MSVHVLSREMDSCKYSPKFVCVAHVDGQHSGCSIFLFVIPGPVVGEFPAQNDVNLAPAPSLPQVTHLSSGTDVCGCSSFSDSAQTFCTLVFTASGGPGHD